MTKEKNWMDWTPEKNGKLPGMPEQSPAGLAPQGHDRRAAKRAKSFDDLKPDEIAFDEESAVSKAPECAELRPTKPGSAFGAYFVPVSFAAKDWRVTPRRIRALLTAGRLAGRVQDNGYWEVRWPYLFAMGTRGPVLKRHQKSAPPLRLVPADPERRTE